MQSTNVTWHMIMHCDHKALLKLSQPQLPEASSPNIMYTQNYEKTLLANRDNYI